MNVTETDVSVIVYVLADKDVGVSRETQVLAGFTESLLTFRSVPAV